jgi:radical SAM superfamily enzyme
MIMETARQLACLPVKGIKIHQLMIIRDTVLQAWYEAGKISCLTLEDYTSLLSEFLSYLRPDQHIHRIVANASVRTGLVAPLWSATKPAAMEYITSYMDAVGTVQGSSWRGT